MINATSAAVPSAEAIERLASSQPSSLYIFYSLTISRGDEGFLETVHFNLHFGTESRARLHAPEVREVLGAALNSSRAIPEAEAGSLTLTERKLEAPRRRIVHHHRRHKTSKHESVFPGEDAEAEAIRTFRF